MRFGTKTYSAAGFYDELIERQRAVDSTIVDMGISFTIYSEGDNIDRASPVICPSLVNHEALAAL